MSELQRLRQLEAMVEEVSLPPNDSNGQFSSVLQINAEDFIHLNRYTLACHW